MKRCSIASAAVLIGVLLVAAPASASFPGTNGKIAFTSDRGGSAEIYVMNPDGSGQAPFADASPYTDWNPAWSPDGKRIVIACYDSTAFCLRSADGTDLGSFFGHFDYIYNPSWSPDGTQVAFEETVEYCDDTEDCNSSEEIAVVGIDGTGHGYLTSNDGWLDQDPSWSPAGDKVLYTSAQHGLRTVNPNTGMATTLPVCCSDPTWSPDATKIAYTHYVGTTTEIFVANPDGSGETRLTTNAVYDSAPVWSPDGTKIAFVSSEGGDAEIFVMNADGSGRQALTNNAAGDSQPDWQPLPPTGYARPKGAYLVTVSLVPAYSACTAPNRAHGPPLDSGSCTPPQRSATHLTLGTHDANGQPTKSVGSVRVRTVIGNPVTPADEADARIVLDITDVRIAADLSDYAGQLEARLGMRITDKLGGVAATVEDTTLAAPAQCAETPDPAIGGHCTLVTTADALAPGTVREGKRTVWALDAVQVNYNGAPFATQGVFVP